MVVKSPWPRAAELRKGVLLALSVDSEKAFFQVSGYMSGLIQSYCECMHLNFESAAVSGYVFRLARKSQCGITHL